MKYKLSRYWNRFAFGVMHLGKLLIWDQTGMNKDYLDSLIDETAEAILCDKV